MFDEKEYHKQYMQKWRVTHPNSHKKYYTKKKGQIGWLRRGYKITLEDYNKKFLEQNGLCAICYTHQSSDKRSFAVDHDHATGKIRGLLCFSCNISLGHFKDNIQHLQNAIAYLERSR